MQVWDHVLSNEPAFWPHIVLSYLTLHRRPLLAAATLARCRALVSRPPHLDANKLLRRAYHTFAMTPAALQPTERPFEALPKAVAYPPFKEYPARALEVHRTERRRIADEEDAVRNREQTLVALQVCLHFPPQTCIFVLVYDRSVSRLHTCL